MAILGGPGSAAVAGICAFAALVIAIYQVRPDRAKDYLLLLFCFVKHRYAKSCPAPVWVHTSGRAQLSRNCDPSHLGAEWQRFCSQIACHLRNYTNPVFQVRAWGVSQPAIHPQTLIAAALRGSSVSYPEKYRPVEAPLLRSSVRKHHTIVVLFSKAYFKQVV